MIIEKQYISSEILFSAIEEQLNHDRKAVFTVTGMSMWPFICHGRDQVIVEKYDRTKLKKGDIVLFQTPLGNYVLHRITGLKEDCFETTGDGNCHRDGWYDYSCIKARVVKIIRKGKGISSDSIGWNGVAGMWMLLYPFRRLLLKLLVFIGNTKNKR